MTFTKAKGGTSLRLGVLWMEEYVLDLGEALVDLLISKYKVNLCRAYELAHFIASDTQRFIELSSATSHLIDEVIKEYAKSDLEYLVNAGIAFGLREIRYLPAIPNPPKIIGIGLNYEEYRAMLKYPKPDVPLFFFKPSNTLLGHEDYVIIPRGGRWPGTSSKCLFHEFEMAIVIGRRAKDITKEEAPKHVFGVTIFSDITAHDIEMIQPGFVLYQQRSKAFDTFSPIGPWIVTMDEFIQKSIDIHNLNILRRRNNLVEGKSNTRNMIYKAWDVIEFLSEIMTLEPGDIISLGSPPAGPPEGLQPGDVIEAELEFVGILRNYVK